MTVTAAQVTKKFYVAAVKEVKALVAKEKAKAKAASI
jgi:hypothetical protein